MKSCFVSKTGKELHNFFLRFLDLWAKDKGLGPTGIILDRKLGATGVRWLREFQKANRLGMQSVCGPLTRAKMLYEGFDFVNEARAVDVVDKYVQLDGEVLYWSCGIEATTNEVTAVRRLHRVLHGN